MAAPKNVSALVSLDTFQAFSFQEPSALHVLFFWATWDEPSKPGGAMETLIARLAEVHPGVRFGKVEAEEVTDVTEQFDVSVVPTFVFMKNKAVIDKLEGADAAEVTKRVEKWEKAAAGAGAGAGAVPRALSELNDRLAKLVAAAPVMAFIKGSPAEPRCKFSRRLVDLLKAAGCAFGSFDVLSSEAVRQGLKEFSNWPTYPQLFVNGKLVGGIDIVQELADSGELASALPAAAMAAAPPTAPGGATGADALPADLRARLERLVSSQPVMLFMKGTPADPACGFSERLAELLKAGGVPFGAFDILSDPRVREGLKAYADWPTYPMVFAHGKLVGGVDIVKAMAEDGAGASLAAQLGVEPKEPLRDRLARLVACAHVVLFMKGSADAPRCGFSSRAIDALREAGVDTAAAVPATAGAASPASAAGSAKPRFSTFDILADDEVRQGLKEFSNWPTYPQLYVDGKLVGGLDIMKELAEEGELATLLAAAGSA